MYHNPFIEMLLEWTILSNWHWKILLKFGTVILGLQCKWWYEPSVFLFIIIGCTQNLCLRFVFPLSNAQTNSWNIKSLSFKSEMLLQPFWINITNVCTLLYKSCAQTVYTRSHAIHRSDGNTRVGCECRSHRNASHRIARMETGLYSNILCVKKPFSKEVNSNS